MSSYSGEIGLHYRTAYCASKFAVTGFFESLRMELSDYIDITIICPITVETSFRENSLIKPRTVELQTNPESVAASYEETKRQGSSMTVEDAIDVILKAIDCRMRKIFFPSKAWLANYVRPLFPDVIDRKLYNMAKL
jgi:short-subunit dehydrogenase